MEDISKLVLRSQISRVGETTPVRRKPSEPSNHTNFEEVLAKELNISKHASKRLEAREIQLSTNQKSQISNALNRLEQKGARDSLVLMDELALVVNVPSKTVVTAMTREQMQERVFTNIDSTMIV